MKIVVDLLLQIQEDDSDSITVETCEGMRDFNSAAQISHH